MPLLVTGWQIMGAEDFLQMRQNTFSVEKKHHVSRKRMHFLKIQWDANTPLALPWQCLCNKSIIFA